MKYNQASLVDTTFQKFFLEKGSVQMPIFTKLPNSYLADTVIEGGRGDIGMVSGIMPETNYNAATLIINFTEVTPVGAGNDVREEEKMLGKPFYPVALTFPANDPLALDVIISNLIVCRNKYYSEHKPFEIHPRARLRNKDGDSSK